MIKNKSKKYMKEDWLEQDNGKSEKIEFELDWWDPQKGRNEMVKEKASAKQHQKSIFSYLHFHETTQVFRSGKWTSN